MMEPQTLPPGYTIVHIDGEWYPLEVTLFYPHASLFAQGLLDDQCEYLHFSLRQDAVNACHAHWQHQQERECKRWESLTAQSNLFPDRCVHYCDEIQSITNIEPIISRFETAEVFVVCHWCPFCGAYQPSRTFQALTVEEALAEAAEQTYATRCRCTELVEAPSPVLESVA